MSDELALAYLLEKGDLFCNQIRVDDTPTYTICLYVDCSDVFYWGCSDAQGLPLDEIINLYKMVKVDRKWGSTKWCVLQRKQWPQEPVMKAMKKDGVWDEQMENLGNVNTN